MVDARSEGALSRRSVATGQRWGCWGMSRYAHFDPLRYNNWWSALLSHLGVTGPCHNTPLMQHMVVWEEVPWGLMLASIFLWQRGWLREKRKKARPCTWTSCTSWINDWNHPRIDWINFINKSSFVFLWLLDVLLLLCLNKHTMVTKHNQ